MRLLVLSLNYSPEPTGFAPHVAAACEYFGRQGHDVTVMTGFPFSPGWKRWHEYRGKFIAKESINGVHVTRLSHFIPKRPGSFIQRIWMEASFCLVLLPTCLLRRSRWDLILYVGAQPGIAFAASCLSMAFQKPYVINVNDLATQAAGDVGILRPGRLMRFLSWIEFAAYRRAAGAFVLCDSFESALIEKGYPSQRIRLIRPPVDLDSIRPVASNGRFRKANGCTSLDFVVLYSGSMGLKQGLMTVLDAAEILQESRSNLRWLLVGDGEQRCRLEQQIETRQLSNCVRLIPFQDQSLMADMYASSDLLLLSQLKMVKDSVIPSKLLTYMAAGRPVVAAVNSSSQAAVLLEAAGGGLLIAPEESQALASAVVWAQENTDKIVAMGTRNRRYAEEHFDQRKITAAQEQFLREIVRDSVERKQR
jgi:colanic acid biosynthesis glycosyl transferase WcaI